MIIGQPAHVGRDELADELAFALSKATHDATLEMRRSACPRACPAGAANNSYVERAPGRSGPGSERRVSAGFATFRAIKPSTFR